MNTKTYLMQVERLDKMIQNKLSEINQIKCMETSITASPKDVNVQSSGSQDKLGDAVSKLVDLERETDALVDKYIDMRRKIIGQIDSIDDVNMYHVLSERYVARKDWNAISVEMGFTFRNVMKIHGRALREFERKFGMEYLEN